MRENRWVVADLCGSSCLFRGVVSLVTKRHLFPCLMSLLIVILTVGCRSTSETQPVAANAASGIPPVAQSTAEPLQVAAGVEEERVVRFITFLAGSPLSSMERATVLEEDANDRRRIPAKVAQGDVIIAKLLKRYDASNATQQSLLRQSEMNAIFGQPEPPVEDPRSMAIVQRHNRVLAANSAAHLVLSEQSAAGILLEVDMMNSYQGRPPLPEAARRSFAQQLPALFRQADSKRQGYMSFAASDASALRKLLESFSAADRAKYQQTLAGTPATALLLEQAAENTLLKHNAVIAAQRRSNDGFLRESNRSIQMGYKIGLSPLLPH